ncbi:preprotein translocase subunit Tim44 [Photobacterium proteolyticum]|uniref:Preprotein translocase subunit Tim44 n=1 Tax=Photobacterium proteolyticum TaxID=1903952 RepID=A0A1Q9GNC0_9GAMM|nr:TIM44-like domain-containing protein [Photobacterium proteolyticum]OLQ76160.1 preprotein translocase subunit Tim44 [Photobacterium proteolyticum]
MKRFFTVFALILTVSFMTPHAEAKKFGGGKSFGKSFKTAPVKQQQPKQTDTLKQQQPAKSSKKGLMGGLLGGLLAGGLLAAFFGGAFEGIQFMDILIFGLIAFVIFKLFKTMRGAKRTPMGHREAYAGNSPRQNQHRQAAEGMNSGFAQQESYTSTDSDVPFNLPPGFNMNAFLNGARDHYRIIQGAWNHNELDKIREYVSPALFDDLAAERAKLDGEQHTEVMYVDAELVRADYDASTAQISIKFSGRYKDRNEGVEEDITDIWHLERDLRAQNAPWLIVGIQA